MTTVEFQRKWGELEDLLFGFAMRLTRNKEDAKDLMQETVMKAFRYRSKYQKNTNFKAWTTTIMRNTFINIYRKNRNRNNIEAPIEDFLYALEDRTADEQADAGVRIGDLQKLLGTLSNTYRIPFLMAFQGYEYKEIAHTLDLPIGTIKSRIHSARQKLKNAVNTHYSDQKV